MTEAKDGIGERFGVFGLNQNASAYHFGDSCYARGDNRFSSGHRLEKYNAEAFLGAGQAKYIAAIVFGGQGIRTDFAEPMQGRFDTQLRRELPQALVLRAVADNSNL